MAIAVDTMASLMRDGLILKLTMDADVNVNPD